MTTRRNTGPHMRPDPDNKGKTVILDRWPTREEKTEEFRQKLRETRGSK